jgi:hypothetical protein
VGASVRVLAAFALAHGAMAGAPRRAPAQTVRDGASVVVAPGARVRVSTPAAGRIVGTLLRATTDSVVVEVASGSSVAFPAGGISRLELSAGVQRHGWKGAGIGLLVGAGVGGVIGLATYRRTECDEPLLDLFVCSFVDRTSREVTVIADAAMVGTLGAVAGALIGHAARESWVRVPLLPEGSRVGLMTATRGSRHGIAVAVAFH